MDSAKLQAFFLMYVSEVVEQCKAEYRYGWDQQKTMLKPLVAVNCALGVDNTELNRAIKSLEDAQMHLRIVRDDYLLRLDKRVKGMEFCEDLT